MHGHALPGVAVVVMSPFRRGDIGRAGGRQEGQYGVHDHQRDGRAVEDGQKATVPSHSTCS
jgi:hypothetical protein